MLKYARLLVEMSLEGPFLEYIDFINNNDILVRHEVTYEWLPIKCTHCRMLGHDVTMCSKKELTRKEWRRVQQDNVTQPQPDQESFIPIARSAVAKQTEVCLSIAPSNQTNAFSILMNKEVINIEEHEPEKGGDPNQRKSLWHNMESIASQMTELWCVLGDFNSVLSPADRIGGNEIRDQELLTMHSELQCTGDAKYRSTFFMDKQHYLEQN
ncbi:LOW QUALITY PROTEIN: hypothetical protein Cgig2_003199 [Carnegiea gigantea]|uniref:Uncharacterized protein n=1 Tax=Carnegiea gigantea TaxID=171969 RepID=A0A9Q1QCK6_9CARY|nr:LOW QUALITY PROTEIN: hypothetical protein Cgig2_003199 [Carnegiea gigantea]